jgi:hypothetical protein
MSAIKSVRRGSLEICYNAVEILGSIIDVSYFQNISIEKRRMCIVIHKILSETDDDITLKQFINKQLDNITDYLIIAFKIIVDRYDEIIRNISEMIEDSTVYENEGEYLSACNTSKQMYALCQAINNKRDYLLNPETFYTWQKVTKIDNDTYATLKLILELEHD